ncbi:MAG: 2-hydroxyglutaryl-CoA dehydratase [Chloroflexi bacterium]|nr:2-hydroxyglutaryl-CoA dehydratase [Chloroflexota bacterium]
MLFMGIDIGSRGAKGVVIEDNQIATAFIGDTGPESVKTSEMVRDNMLAKLGMDMSKITYTMATGYGRVLVPFAAENVSEISAHAKGAHWYFPSVRTILDMGGQDCKAINVNDKGQVTKFIMNDKCAGGTGRFLELIASVLGLRLEDIGQTSLESKKNFPFNTVCAVFAKSEAISLMKKGTPKSDILAGLHDAIAVRCYNLLKRVNIEKDFTITGGIAKNQGMVAKIKEKLGMEPVLAPDPQIMGALGASLFARERYMAKQNAAPAS